MFSAVCYDEGLGIGTIFGDWCLRNTGNAGKNGGGIIYRVGGVCHVGASGGWQMLLEKWKSRLAGD